MKELLINGNRFDYFLIWGHGLKDQEGIIKLIEDNPQLKLKLFIEHNVSNIGKFVKEVYSYDYAPFYHLKNKTKYLKKTPKKVLIIIVENLNPNVEWFGVESFRHSESMTIKKQKEQIREKFNPRINGRRTENHVIHASDNMDQCIKILKVLGYEKRNLGSTAGLFNIPSFIQYKCVCYKKLDLNTLYCSIITSSDPLEENRIVKIIDSPQYLFLSGDTTCYEKYIEKYRGNKLTSYYSSSKFLKLNNCFDIEEYTPIVVRKINDLNVIQDGLHRAAILKYRNINCIKAIVVNE